MPPKAWHAGRDLGTILRDYLEKLSREENGSHWAFHKTWNAYVSKFDSMRGFKVDTNAERLFSHPFTTKKDAQVHALALLARGTRSTRTKSRRYRRTGSRWSRSAPPRSTRGRSPRAWTARTRAAARATGS